MALSCADRVCFVILEDGGLNIVVCICTVPDAENMKEFGA